MTPPAVGIEIGTVDGLKARMSFWLQNYLKLVGRNPDNTVVNQAVGATPYTYMNNGDFNIDAVITGGTIMNISLLRNGVLTLLSTTTNLTVTLNPGDGVTIAFSLPPQLNLIPR